ncbi:SDR family NAD(P)-dependent oxidoreductase [Terrarubrum flagellatum]|uniref:SDR family NAD(P)-dependent oxidoreductase n=1 Tax=Terrirubrum flagellatum TaxID=2895980 RepID=UPI003144FFCE
MSLVDQHVLVTGAGRGIGAAIAARLTRDGARVTALGRSEAPLQALVARGAAASYETADVTSEAAMAEACAKAAAKNGPIDVLIANAGGAESAPFLKTNAAAFQRMFDLNVMGVANGARAVLPGMIERRKGRIIAVASTAGLRGYAYVSAYVASKHAVIGLVRSLALETARSGVTINAVCPGFADTDMTEESIAKIMEKTGRKRDQALAELAKHNPQGRLIAPEEVADAVAWLIGPAASAITGQSIAVAGGEVM